jgi:hypothetical protein
MQMDGATCNPHDFPINVTMIVTAPPAILALLSIWILSVFIGFLTIIFHI